MKYLKVILFDFYKSYPHLKGFKQDGLWGIQKRRTPGRSQDRSQDAHNCTYECKRQKNEEKTKRTTYETNNPAGQTVGKSDKGMNRKYKWPKNRDSLKSTKEDYKRN